MPRVISLSNHPYNGKMIAKGEHYDIAEADLALHEQLRRVRKATQAEAAAADAKNPQAYKTRDMQAERGVIMGARGNIPAQSQRPVAPQASETAAPAATPHASTEAASVARRPATSKPSTTTAPK